MTLPLTVNVVPGDEAAGRIPHPTVQSEVLFQEAQDAKRQASEAFERGDVEAGKALFGLTKDQLQRALEVAPDSAAGEIRAELADIDRMDSVADVAGGAYVSKMSRDSYHRMNRKRGRAVRPEDETE